MISCLFISLRQQLLPEYKECLHQLGDPQALPTQKCDILNFVKK